VVEEAVTKGLITQEQGKKLLPDYSPIAAETTKLLTGNGLA
jgi:hypothetical protein